MTRNGCHRRGEGGTGKVERSSVVRAQQLLPVQTSTPSNTPPADEWSRHSSYRSANDVAFDIWSRSN